MTILEKIQKILSEKFSPLQLEIQDDSGKHVGHQGAGGGGHYRVRLASSLFAGKSLIEQHRLVHEALKDLFPKEIHALALETRSSCFEKA